MRVLSITTDAFGQIGGIAQYNRDFLTAICHHPRCEEVIVMSRLVLQSPGKLPPKLTMPTRKKSGKLQFSLAVLWRALREKHIDLVLCGHINLLPLAYLASRLLRAPLVLMVYGIDVWQPSGSRLINRLATRVEAVCSISQITLDKFLAWASPRRLKSFIVPNAIDLRRFVPARKDRNLLARYGLEGKTVLATLGRLAAHEGYKGVDEILDVLPALRKELPDLAYLVIGDGTDRARLEQKARSLGLNGAAIFPGYIPEEEKLAHYQLVDAYVMPSRGEGFGFVFLEALAAGVPVLASKLDGGREAVRNGLLGVLVDPHDPEEIKHGIRAVLQKPRGVVPEGLDYFSYERFEQRVHRLVENVVEGREALSER